MTKMAMPVSSRRRPASVRPPSRPTALMLPVEATAVISNETTRGITVMRMALTQSVPIGAIASAAAMSVALPDAATATPATMATPRARRTRVLSFIVDSHSKDTEGVISHHKAGNQGFVAEALPTNAAGRAGSHHQIAAVDVERRAGDVAGRLRRREADQVGHFQRRPEPRHGIARRQPLQQLGRGVLARQLAVDHPGADGVDGDAELPQLLRRRPRQAEHPRLRGR